NNPGQVAQVKADHRLLAAVQNGAHHIAYLAVSDRFVVLNAYDFEEGRILVEVHAVLESTFERPHAHLVGAVHVVDIATPQFLELIAKRVVGVGAQAATEKLRPQITDVKFEFITRYLGKLRRVFGPHVPDVGAPLARNFDLTA